MAGAWVQGRSIQQVGGTNISLAYNTQNLAAGNALVVGAVAFGTSFAAATCADGGGETFTRHQAQASGGATCVIFSAPNAVGGNKPTVTVTVSGTNDKSITIAEFSGMVTASLADVGTGNTGTTTPFGTGTTAATAQADEVVVWVAGHDGPTNVTPTASGYTVPAANTQSATAQMPISLGWKAVAATGTQVASVAWTNASGGWAAVIETFKAAAAAAKAPAPYQRRARIVTQRRIGRG